MAFRADEVRAIVFEFNPKMLIDVVIRLSECYAWNPIYCVASNTRDVMKTYFPSIIYQDTNDARFGRSAPELADMHAAAIIDQPTAEELGYAEVNALKQMDRMELLGGFTLRERILLFHRLVNYWSAVFDRLKPDVLLMTTAPHVTYDYVAYMLARKRGIPVILFEYVTSDGLIMAIDHFEDGLPPLMAEYQRLCSSPQPTPLRLSERMENYWHRLHGTHDQVIPFSARKILADTEARKVAARQTEQRAEVRPTTMIRPFEFFWHLREVLTPLRSSKRQLIRSLPASLGQAFRKTFGPPPDPALHLLPPPPPPVDGHYKGRFYEWAPENLARASAEFRRQHSETMQRRYHELAVGPDLTRPYVYVALSMQPERATNPNGGVFDDQDVMVGIIAAALPEGWHVYVKEHPSQYLDGVRVERGRWERFYDAVVAHANVSLVPMQTPSFDLIDSARAVASVTGTSSWEAIARGVPALVFGEAWYKNCEGAYTIRTKDDCKRALAEIAAGRRPDPELVRLFLHAVEKTAFVGYLDPDERDTAQIDEASNIANLARAIAERYEAATVEANRKRIR